MSMTGCKLIERLSSIWNEFLQGFDAYGLDKSAREDEKGILEASSTRKIDCIVQWNCSSVFVSTCIDRR